MSEAPAREETQPPAHAHSYVVVARRYRPQAFEELIGQEHVAQALSNAIQTDRVGHAYLFTGARGVGKTSAARILAKALNCSTGPTPVPCNRCDICQSISSGDDVDVLEIDGASNRGIDEIRQLRQNVNVRPSRSRFKIYIIDEVHMLTREAFNALLKTLEEPPEHVKFIFCTTEPTKIPITILSRCQRFDFAGISTRSIFDRLRQIVTAEGVEAESEALEVIARRAAGSMRDSQSLLEQLLAFAPERITVKDVHGMLGTAGDQRLSALVRHVVERNAAAALAELDAAAQEGVDVAQLIEQLFGCLRDCMMAAVGCPASTFLYASPSNSADVVEAGKRLGLQTILVAMQILDQALSRLRYSTQSRILAELALVRLCHLEDLDELAGWIAQLQSGQPAAGPGAQALRVPLTPRVPLAPPVPAPAAEPVAGPSAGKKNIEPSVSPRGVAPVVTSDALAEPVAPRRVPLAPPVSSLDEPAGAVENAEGQVSPTRAPLTAENAAAVWAQALEKLSGMVVDHARLFDRVALSGPSRLSVSFPPQYTLARSACQRPEQVARFEQALADVTGQTVRVEFLLSAEGANGQEAVAPAPRPVPLHQRLMEVQRHPMIRRAGELFGAHPVSMDDP